MNLAYYNEIDPYAAQWLRNLIAAGHIAPGVVDERDIRDIAPDELAGFTQCHFFAGIGGWSLALRIAVWPDDRPVWTASCPCQPFSAAGARGGFADERHLWPHAHWLIRQRRPDVVFGEQVASKDGLAWLDLVQADLEGEGYTFGAADLCSAGVGAPHIRQRLHWVADVCGKSSQRGARGFSRAKEKIGGEGESDGNISHRSTNGREVGVALGDASGQGLPLRERDGRVQRGTLGASEGQAAVGAGDVGELADALPAGRPERRPEPGHGSLAWRSPTRGFWEDAEWLACSDGKARPVEPGTFPLAHGVSGRVGRLRAYGNAINPWLAAEFIAAYRNI